MLSALAAPAVHAQTVLPDSLAARHTGELVTIVGLVHDVHVSVPHGVTFLNFGGAFPSITFSAHVPDSVSAKISELRSWAGQRVRVTGRIWPQEDRWPAITVTDSAQLHRLE